MLSALLTYQTKNVVPSIFSDALSTISSGIGKMVELTHLSIELNDLVSCQTVKLHVYREQKQYFEVYICGV